MLSLVTEFLLGFLVLLCVLVGWKNDIDLKAIRKDFEEVKKELETAGVLKKLKLPDRGGSTCLGSRNASGNGGHHSGRP